MCTQLLISTYKRILASLIVVVLANTSCAAAETSQTNPVIRTYGTDGGYRTEVKSETNGVLTEENLRQAAFLTAQIFEHIDHAQKSIDADNLEVSHHQVEMGRLAVKAVRNLLPVTIVQTKTTAPDGNIVYEDRRDVQEDRVPLFEEMLSTKTMAPIASAKQDARDSVEIKGVRLVGSETIITEAYAHLDYVEGQLERAFKALKDNKADQAAKALTLAQVRGVEFRFRKEDTPLAAARDAIWLTKRALEENNNIQAQTNLSIARQQLEMYRQLLPDGQRQDVTQMMKEVGDLDAKLRQDSTGATKQSNNRSQETDRASQGRDVTKWWEQINGWFKKGT